MSTYNNPSSFLDGMGLKVQESWSEIIERVRVEHNGVMRVDLYFGHDGDNICRFSDYDKIIAAGESGTSMQEAAERCIANWHLKQDVEFSTKHGDLYETCSVCGREKWTHGHPMLYGDCKATGGNAA